MREKKFSVKERLNSFRYAFRGVSILLRNEHNARIHLCAALLAIGGGLYFNITVTEWMAVIFAIGIVFCAEAVNSAIEYLADAVSPEYNELIGKAKDLAAGAVLFVAIAAAIAGCIIFIPYIFSL